MIDKARLFAKRLPSDTVPIPGVGHVTVRGLSRDETADIPNLTGAERESTIISRAMVDPELTVDEVRQWMKAAPAGEFDKVSTKIGELSGLLESSGKDAYKSPGRRPRA